MDVPSYQFLAFAALVALVINVSSTAKWRRAVFLVANLGFIATFTRDLAQLAPFAALLALGYVGIKLLESQKRRVLFIVLVTLTVVAFCWLKRYTFIPHALFLTRPYFVVGMSYVFFRILHLVIDAYQDALPARLGILSYVNYTLNFTALVSGPIQLYRDYHRTESVAPLGLDLATAGRAARRIIVGFFKVSIISPALYWVFQRGVAVLSGTPEFGARAGWAGIILAVFPIYIYFNFSGYMDVVIGVARFLRLELPENFNRPFTSTSFIEFWSRWHMTLSNWMKTYVYSPLFLALMYRFPRPQVQPWLGVFSYFVAFFLIGVWHGRTSMFIFLGVLLGLGVSVNKLYELEMVRRLGRARYTALCANPLHAALSRGLTFSWFAIATLWFWATWAQLARFASILGLAGIGAALLILLAAATLALVAFKYAQTQADDVGLKAQPQTAVGYLRTAWYTALAVVTISVVVVLNAPAPHIIYRAF